MHLGRISGGGGRAAAGGGKESGLGSEGEVYTRVDGVPSGLCHGRALLMCGREGDREWVELGEWKDCYESASAWVFWIVGAAPVVEAHVG